MPWESPVLTRMAFDAGAFDAGAFDAGALVGMAPWPADAGIAELPPPIERLRGLALLVVANIFPAYDGL